MIEGFIFDLDGTLLNSLQDLGNAVNRTLIKQGLKPHDLDKYRFFVGNGVHKLVERAFGSDYLHLDQAFEIFYEDYTQNCTKDSFLYDGVKDFLKELNRCKIPIAICTNKAQDLTDKIIEHYFFDVDFVDVIGDRFDGLKKPNPHYPLEIAEKMGLKPESIIFMGDSDVDMLTAKASGFKAVGVSWGFRPQEELLDKGADLIVTDIKDLVSEIS